MEYDKENYRAVEIREDETLATIEKLMANARYQTSISNRRWVSTTSLAFLALTVRTEKGTELYKILGAELDETIFFFSIVLIVSMSNIAFASAFAAAAKTGRIINDLIFEIDPTRMLNGKLPEFAKKLHKTPSELAQDILRTGMGSDYVRIAPILLGPTVKFGSNTKVYLKTLVDGIFIATPPIALFAFIFVKANTSIGEVSPWYPLGVLFALCLAAFSAFFSALTAAPVLGNLSRLYGGGSD